MLPCQSDVVRRLMTELGGELQSCHSGERQECRLAELRDTVGIQVEQLALELADAQGVEAAPSRGVGPRGCARTWACLWGMLRAWGAGGVRRGGPASSGRISASVAARSGGALFVGGHGPVDLVTRRLPERVEALPSKLGQARGPSPSSYLS
jgi:hypothetical protein